MDITHPQEEDLQRLSRLLKRHAREHTFHVDVFGESVISGGGVRCKKWHDLQWKAGDGDDMVF